MALPELAISLEVSETDTLLQAEQAVRDYCRWHIAPSRTESLTLDGSGSPTLLLPTLRLTALDAATNDGLALDVATDVEWSEAGIVRLSCGCWTRKLRGVVLEVTHGHTAPPADVVGVVQAVASRTTGNPAALKSKTVGPFSWTYGDVAPFLATEMAILDRYRLPSRA